MKIPFTNPAYWRVDTLLSLGCDAVHELAKSATGTLTTYRLIVGRCLLALHRNKGYKTRGCSSAVHYASSVLGLEVRQARSCKRVAHRLLDLPELTIAAENGRESWGKLREIVRKATPQTESYWLKLAAVYSYKEIEILVRRTPKGSVPGDVDTGEPSVSTELRCSVSPQVLEMLKRARRMLSIEKDELVTSNEILEYALVSYLSSQAVDTEVLEQVRSEANKDLQAEQARQIPLIAEARELAEEFGLIGELADSAESSEHAEDSEKAESAKEIEPTEELEPLIEALGYEPLIGLETETQLESAKPNQPDTLSKKPVRVTSWKNPRLRYNPLARGTTKAQKTEILRRDGWCCRTPGCPNKV